MRFYLDNARWLIAAMLLTFVSGYGQTIFIALFAGEIRAEFGLSHGEWGTLYALGTLASAVLMLCTGGLADTHPARRSTLVVVGLFLVATLAMATVAQVWLLPVVIFGLRYCGQGMLGHLSAVFVGRWFVRNRGKSIAVSSLGFSLAEASLPIVFVSIMLTWSWRTGWYVAAASLLVFGTLFWFLLARERVAQNHETHANDAVGMDGRHWTRAEMLRQRVFWIVLCGFLANPLIATTLFFQMVHLADVKGWPLGGLVSLMPVYSVCTLASLFLSGAVVDRVGLKWVLALFLIPLALSMIAFAFGQDLSVAALAFARMGVASGAAWVVSGTFWPEFYGTRHLGSVRAVATTVMVFASALGPLGSGWLLDLGFGLDRQFLGLALWCFFCAGLFALTAFGGYKTGNRTGEHHGV